MLAKRGVAAAPVKGRRVLVRVDFNVPLDARGDVADEGRIVEALPTLEHLRTAGARTILLSHLGRPGGRRDPRFSLKPVARRLGPPHRAPGPVAEDIVGVGANDPAFAAQLAQLGELFVQEAFGTVHRAHASTVGVPKRLPSCAGLLVEREVRALSRLVDGPDRPFAVVAGGAKVADKLPLLESLLGRTDTLLIGGALAHPFLAAGGASLGATEVEPGMERAVAGFLERARGASTTVGLPTDLVVERADGTPTVCPVARVPADGLARDIGPESVARFAAALQGARTVFWNGPLGKAEDPRFADGTRRVLGALAGAPGFHVAAGGDSGRVARELGVAGVFQFISTGGGAALEFVEGVELPGLAVLPNA